MSSRVRERKRHLGSVVDLLAILGIAIVAFVVATRVDAFEKLVEAFGPAHLPALVELVTALIIASVALAVFSVRRVVELTKEIAEHRRAEAALRASEEKYRLLFERSPDSIALVDLDGRVLDCNGATSALAGMPKEQLVGRRLTELTDLHEKSMGTCVELLPRLARGEEVGPIEMRVVGADAAPCWLEVYPVLLRENGEPSAIQAVTRDVTERKRAGQALQESEERFRAVFETAEDSIFTKGLDLRYKAVNPTVERLFGRPASELVGSTDRELFAEGEAAHTRETDRRVLAGETVDEEHTKCVQGKPLTFHVIKAPMRDRSGAVIGLCGIARDITERKLAQEALRESEARYRLHFENVAEVVYSIDTGLRIAGISPSVEGILGYRPEELLGKRFAALGLLTPDSLQEALADARRVLGGERIVSAIYEFIAKDGSRKYVEVSGAPLRRDGQVVGLVSVARDVTARYRAEAALRASEKRYRALVENMPMVCFTFDREGRILTWNRAAEQVYAYTKAEAVGRSAYDLIVTTDTRQATDEVIAAVFAGQCVTGSEWHDHTKSGEVGWRMGNSFPLFAADGRVECGVNLNIDITERKRLEDQLRRSSKMEAIGRLAGGIAHDFNNLLTAISGYSHLLLSRLDEDDPLHNDVNEIRRAGDRAAELTRQLLAFSRRQMLHPVVLDLNAVVADTEKMLRRVIGEDIALATSLDSDLGLVEADAGQIEQVVMNLAVNSRDAMPHGGEITIGTANVDVGEVRAREDAEIAPGEYVTLSLSDTGAGMDEETLARIFEPFFTTKQPGQGTGLGLSTVYGIVKQSGGSIRVRSAPGQGSTFAVYLPRVAQQQRPAPRSQPPAGALRGTETILVVEDEKIVRDLTCTILEQHGYKVLQAQSAGGALIASDRHQGDIRLMVTDVVMPVINGIELATRLAESRPQMKVLYMSGYADRAGSQDGMVRPGTPFIQKPFTPDSLARKVRDVLERP